MHPTDYILKLLECRIYKTGIVSGSLEMLQASAGWQVFYLNLYSF